MKWVTVGTAHWNTDLIPAFLWRGGMLSIWWQGEAETNPDVYKDPDRAQYKRLCLARGVAEVSADGKG